MTVEENPSHCVPPPADSEGGEMDQTLVDPEAVTRALALVCIKRGPDQTAEAFRNLGKSAARVIRKALHRIGRPDLAALPAH